VLKALELAAQALKLQSQFLDVQRPKDIDTAFPAVKTGRAEEVLVLMTGPLASHRTQVLVLAVKNQRRCNSLQMSWKMGGL
jgi:hypothetical protein